MKKIHFLLIVIPVLLMGCFSKNEARISIDIDGYEKNTPIVIQISDGIGSLSFWEPDTVVANKKGEFEIEIPIKDPKVVTIHPLQFNGTFISRPILISKGGKYNISLSVKNPQKTIMDPVFEGKNEKGVLQLIQFDNYIALQEGKNSFFNASSPSELQPKIYEKIQIELKPFENFLKNGSIDKPFYDYANQYISYYFAYKSIQYINSETTKSDTSKTKEWHELKKTIFKNFPVSNQSILLSHVGKEYIDLYISELIQENKTEYDEALKQSLGQTFVFQKMKKVLHSNVFKYVALQYIDSKVIRLDYETITLFELYTKLHPDCMESPIYKKIQNQSIPSIKAFYASKDKALQSEIVVLDDSYEINSLKEITQKFQGQYVFIDIWASWCPDCISEFKYNDVLKKYLKEKNIPIVYIAFERSPDREKWKLYLNKYQLLGNHVKCSDALKEDLYRILGTRSVWIPRYMLIGPNGDVVISDAPTPSSGKKLYDLIDSKINNVIVNP